MKANIIKVKVHFSETFQEILKKTNKYLVTNKGVAVDYNVLKEISERASHSFEQYIHSTIAIPLYIGLLGTMFGIIYSLFMLKTPITDESLNALLGGVKIAMIGSFGGLLLTLINTGFNLKKAAKIRDDNKHNYYTFLQVNLLPTLSNDIFSSLRSIEFNLAQFNNTFSENIINFNSTIMRVFDNVKVEKELIDRLDNIGFNRIIKYNASMFENMNQFADKISLLNQYTASFTESINASSKIITQIAALVNKIDFADQNIQSLIGEFKMRVEGIDTMLSYLKVNYTSIDGVSDQIRQLLNSQEKAFKETSANYDTFITKYSETSSDKILEITQNTEKLLKELALNFEKILKENSDHYKTVIAEVETNNVSKFKEIIEKADQEIKANVSNLNIVNINENLNKIQDGLKKTISIVESKGSQDIKQINFLLVEINNSIIKLNTDLAKINNENSKTHSNYYSMIY